MADLSQYLQYNSLATNIEQKLYFQISEHLQRAQNYQRKIDQYIDGYLDKDMHKALLDYISKMNLTKISKPELDLILSRVFDKTCETRALKTYVESLVASG